MEGVHRAHVVHRRRPSGIVAAMASIGPIQGGLHGRRGRWSCVALLMLVAAVVAGCGGSRHVALDARALVAQPRDVGGIRSVDGGWNELGDEGVYPLADALQSKSALRPDVAYLATYDGLVGADAGLHIASLAVVLPTMRAARRLLADSMRVEAFVEGASAPLSSAPPTNGADATESGMKGHSTVIAWSKGRFYGMISVNGPGAAFIADRLARAEERRFERGLGGQNVEADPRLPTSLVAPIPPPPTIKTVSPEGPPLRIDRPGRYTLADLGVGALTFEPSAGVDGVAVPVALDLPPSPRGQWLWRSTTHAVVTLAADAPTGMLEIEPFIAQTGGPGPSFVVAQNLSDDRELLIETSRHLATPRSFEVTVIAMLGGAPSSRELTRFGFEIRSYGPQGAFSQVTILPDSAIEVFDDPAEIGQSAVTTPQVISRP
jgi:hypothetical protein